MCRPMNWKTLTVYIKYSIILKLVKKWVNLFPKFDSPKYSLSFGKSGRAQFFSFLPQRVRKEVIVVKLFKNKKSVLGTQRVNNAFAKWLQLIFLLAWQSHTTKIQFSVFCLMFIFPETILTNTNGKISTNWHL